MWACPPLRDLPTCARLSGLSYRRATVCGMTLNLRGIELRYVLTWQLALHGSATIPELLKALTYHGFTVTGRPSKTISDALRWEIARGRVNRIGWGKYSPSAIPRSTQHRIHQRVLALRRQANVRKMFEDLGYSDPGDP